MIYPMQCLNMIKLTFIYFNELVILMSSKRQKAFLQVLSSETKKISALEMRYLFSNAKHILGKFLQLICQQYSVLIMELFPELQVSCYRLVTIFQGLLLPFVLKCRLLWSSILSFLDKLYALGQLKSVHSGCFRLLYK